MSVASFNGTGFHHGGKHGHLVVRKPNSTPHHGGKLGHLTVRKTNSTVHHGGKVGHLTVRKTKSTPHHGHLFAARKANSTRAKAHHFAARDEAPTSTTILLSTVYVSPVPLSTGVEDSPMILSTAPASAAAPDTTGSPTTGDTDTLPTAILYANSTSSYIAPSSVVADPVLLSTGTGSPTTLLTYVSSSSDYPSTTHHGKKGPRPTKMAYQPSELPKVGGKWFEEFKEKYEEYSKDAKHSH